MAIYRDNLPQSDGRMFLAYTGMETDLLFLKGIDLPGFASYPLLETDDGCRILESYYRELIELGRKSNVGVILESPTWVANRDRGAKIGYSPERLAELNKKAIKLISKVRSKSGDLPTVLSANIGPRNDAYAPGEQMTAKEAESYHCEQIATLAETDVDLVSGYTLAYAAEAAGIVLAARRYGLPVTISFTLETDGRLPTGEALGDAIIEVDAATDGYAKYFMINCAHPDHFNEILKGEPWILRLKGVVANASRCSHAELDEAETLDDGNPEELGQQLAAINKKYPHINILGGCCGTDNRHMAQIARQASAN